MRSDPAVTLAFCLFGVAAGCVVVLAIMTLAMVMP
jgi:hypothetical protein